MGARQPGGIGRIDQEMGRLFHGTGKARFERILQECERIVQGLKDVRDGNLTGFSNP